MFGDAAEAEAADEDGGAVLKFGDGGVGGAMRLSMKVISAGRRVLPGRKSVLQAEARL